MKILNNIDFKQLFRFSTKKIVILIVSIVLILGIFSIMVFQPFSNINIVGENERENLIAATEEDKNGISVHSEFTIKTTDYNNIRDLSKNLTVNTDEKYNITKKLFGDYKLKFSAPLKSNKIYNFVLKTLSKGNISFAFQTKQEFKVSRTLPANGSVGAPTDTGIEISFSLVNFSDYENFIQITPKVDGGFHKYGNIVVFEPYDMLADTTYNVLIKKGLTADSGETLKEDYSFLFTTGSSEENSKFINVSGDRVETFLSQDTPVIEMEASKEYKNTEFKTSIFEVQNAEDYSALIRKAVYNNEEYDYDRNTYDIAKTDNLNNILNIKSKLVFPVSDDEYLSYIVLPKQLPVGYYVVNIAGELGGKKVLMQKFIQINDDAVYATSNNGSTLLWVNDVKTAEPLVGAEVLVDNKSMGKSAANGTLKFDTKSEDKNAVIMIKNKSEKPFVACLSLLAPDPNPPLYEKYFSYLYTDREAYLPTDNVKVFGILKPRSNGSIPKTVDVFVYSANKMNEYGEYEYDSYDRPIYDTNQALQKVQVTIGDGGVFTTNLKLDNYSSSSYKIVLAQSEKMISLKTITVENYVKPIYKINLKKQIDVYFSGEQVPLNANVSFYDGTPAKNMKFTVDRDENNKNNVISNKNGDLNTNIVAYYSSYNGNNRWNPETTYIDIESGSAEDSTLSGNREIIVLPRTVMLETRVTGNANEQSVEVSTHLITKDNLTIENYKTENIDDLIRGESVDLPVTVEMKKDTLVKTKTGNAYDFIEKKTVVNYTYKTVTTVESKKVLNTVGGKLVLEKLPTPNSTDELYYYGLSCLDTNGKVVSVDTNSDYYQGLRQGDSLKSYYFTDNDGIYNQYDTATHSLDENVSIKLYEYSTGLVKTGKALYNVIKDRSIDYNVASSDEIKVKFSKDYIPNVYVSGAYFDGKRIFSVSSCMLKYKYEDNSLTIKVTPNKQSYKPGETASLDILVTDKNGKPRAADVNVSVADEAVFSMFPQDLNILSDLYTYCFTEGENKDYVSYREHQFTNSQDGEYGGEGGGELRDEYKDTASFLLVKTDKNGKATATVKLPDNLTSWRITTQAISADNFAGDNIHNITTILPFFADMILNRTYLSKDDIAVTARSFGTAFDTTIAEGATVTYTATLIDAKGGKTTKNAIATAGTVANFNFNSRPSGTYKMQLKAACQGNVDIIEKTFEVKENGTELPISATFDLSKGINVSVLKSPVQLAIYNKDCATLYKALLDIYYSSGSRNDETIAKGLAGEMLNSLADEKDKKYFSAVKQNSKDSYQHDDGGAILYSYDSSSPLLTARFIMADSTSLVEHSAKRYLYNFINDSKDREPNELAAYYFGLAAYKEPVLMQIRSILKSGSAIEPMSTLIYACALSAIGDDKGAKELFDGSFAHQVTITSDTAKFTFDSNVAINDEMNALALYVLTKSDYALAQKVMNNILENPSKTYLSSLEQMYFIKNSPAINSLSKVSYQKDGITEQFSLKNNAVKLLTFTTAQLKSANFKVLSGNVETKATFIGNSQNLSGTNNAIKVKKQFSLAGNAYNIGDDIKVTITVTPPSNSSNYYEIFDFIPSGARFVKATEGTQNDTYWFSKNEGQKVSFGVYSKAGISKTISIVYYIRPVTIGKYSIESAFATDDNKCGWSDRGTIQFEK